MPSLGYIALAALLGIVLGMVINEATHRIPGSDDFWLDGTPHGTQPTDEDWHRSIA